MIYQNKKKFNTIIFGENSHINTPNKNNGLSQFYAAKHDLALKSRVGHLRVGDLLWIFGGMSEHSVYTSALGGVNKKPFKQTMIWHIKKQRWLWGPKNPNNTVILGATGIALNRTSAMLVYPNWNTLNCLDTSTFDFATRTWINNKSCFYNFKHKFMDYTHNLTGMKSTSYFDKYGKLKIIVWIWYKIDDHFENGYWINRIFGLLTFDSNLQNLEFHQNIPESSMKYLSNLIQINI